MENYVTYINNVDGVYFISAEIIVLTHQIKELHKCRYFYTS
jgi:hypothetical protein